MKKIAVILSGCGVFDGAEIHESVLTLLSIDAAGATYRCAAPDKAQHHVVDHKEGAPQEGVSRNVLTESARIARGEITPLSELDAADFDAVILPGGFGAAKNLCTFAIDGKDFTVDETLEAFLREAHRLNKPLAFACIAPAIAAKVFGHAKLKFTIGNDPGTAEALASHGGTHVDCPVDEIVIDEDLQIVTTPAYMLANRITEAQAGISKMVNAVLEMAEAPVTA